MSDVRVMRLAEMSAGEVERLLARGAVDVASVMDKCQSIVEAVRRDGDDAVLAFTKQFDGVDLAPVGLRVAEEEFAAANARLPRGMYAALEYAIGNIRKFHESQLPGGLNLMEVDPGVWCGDRWTPIDAVCLYVPRGRGAFSSVACMLGVPAKIAGAERVIVCTPPGPDGRVDDATLVAARLIGIDEVYRVGGAQAVAAVAYGTESIPRCDKIVGPGNVFVTAARQFLSTVIDPGPPAGPSESLIVCDESADVANAAWNLMIEAEHGENSCALLVTHVEVLGQAIASAVVRQRGELTERRRAFVDEVLSARGGVLLTRDLDESVAFANRFAAEHVALMVADPWAVLPGLRNAGEILVGEYPIISLGNYAMGINAILPTGGRARSSSVVSVTDFMKRASIGYVTAEGFARLKDVVAVMSEDEGFSAHHQAVLQWRGPSSDRRES